MSSDKSNRLCDDDALRDRVAHALARSSPPEVDLPWIELPDYVKAPYDDAATAVLMEIADSVVAIDALLSDELIEAGSWAETPEHGRNGYAVARAVLTEVHAALTGGDS